MPALASQCCFQLILCLSLATTNRDSKPPPDFIQFLLFLGGKIYNHTILTVQSACDVSADELAHCFFISLNLDLLLVAHRCLPSYNVIFTGYPAHAMIPKMNNAALTHSFGLPVSMPPSICCYSWAKNYLITW